MPPLRRTDVGVDWRRSREESRGLLGYVAVFRERRGLIGLTLLVTVALAAAYLVTAEKSYEAEANLLVTPAPANDSSAVAGLPLIRESSDPTRDVETAARLVTARDVAARVISSLGLDETTESMLQRVQAAPVAQSNIVAITGRGPTPEQARDVANAFGRAVIADRTEVIHTAVDQAIERLEAQSESDSLSEPDEVIAAQLFQLRTLRAQDDPTLTLETPAEAPGSPSSPRPVLTIVAALVAGLVLGVGGAFALTTLDPRLRREEQLRELYQLPVLARIPKESKARTMERGARRWRGLGPRRRERRALGPRELSPSTLESYRALRAVLLASAVDSVEGRSVMVTGASPSEGKTTTAINLASSLALAGNRVILIEGDFRRPTVAEALGVTPTHGIGRVLLGTVALEDALSPVPPFGDSLRVLLVRRADELLAELLSLPIGKRILEDAKSLADFVIVDSPPLTEVVDALPFARNVDDLIIVCRMGWSRLQQLNRLNDLLYENGIQPTGFALVGVGTSERSSYYISGQRERMASQPSVRERTGEPAP